MAMGDQLGRQWRIIQTLISSRTGKSASELAQELECNPRTLYRDMEALQVAGFPIYTERSDGKNLWSLLDTMKHQMPVPFTLTELMALYFGRDMLKVFKDTAFYESLESLLQKVRTTLPPESIQYLKNGEQTLHLAIKPYKDYGRFKEILNRVTKAALNRKTIEIVYYTMSRKKETRRRVDPYRVWFFNGTFYLIGFCHMRNEVRIFALDRIKMLHQFDDVVEYSLPDKKLIDRLLRNQLSAFKISKLPFQKISDEAEGLSHAEISKICNDAIKDAIIYDRDNVTANDILELVAERKKLLNKQGVNF